MPRSATRVFRPAATLAAALLASTGAPTAAQSRPSDPVAVTLAAQVHPGITIHELTPPSVTAAAGMPVVTRRLEASANVPFEVVARFPAAGGASGALEVRDRMGAWVRLAPGEGVTVLAARALEVATRAIECRPSGTSVDDADCPLVLELVSTDPTFRVRVTAAAPARGAILSDAAAARPAAGDVAVYVFDGGISDAHPELAGRVRRGFTAFPGDAPTCSGHGTAVAGAIAGATLGVAPSVQVVDVKVVDCWRMRGTVDAIVHATRWVIEDAARHPGRRAIANWSFLVSTTSSIPALDTAVAALTRAGIPVVVSAGNRDQDACRISPANAPDAITVGAAAMARTTRDAAGSSRVPGTAYGRCVDLYAPGDSVLLPGIDGNARPASGHWTGTSIAAGRASGAAALYLQQHPRASVRAVAEHLAAIGTRDATRVAEGG